MQTYSDLNGKVALISGASSGIGAATARAFAASGAKVFLSYFQNEKGGRAAVDSIRQAGGTAQGIKADVRTVAGCQALVAAAVAAFGPVDILVNNAGSLVERMKLMDITEERWDDIYNLNLKSVVFTTQAVAKSMVERKGGVIVNVSSIAGRNGGGIGAGPYASAKAAVTAITKNMAKELAPSNIRANCVSPGVIDTPFHEVFTSPEAMKGFVSGIPMARTGRSDEVAQVIAFLASSASSYLTGETIEVNGGQLML